MNDDTAPDAAASAAFAASTASATASAVADTTAAAPPAAPRAQAATVKPETVKPETDPLFFSRLLRTQHLLEKGARAAKISSLSIV